MGMQIYFSNRKLLFSKSIDIADITSEKVVVAIEQMDRELKLYIFISTQHFVHYLCHNAYVRYL